MTHGLQTQAEDMTENMQGWQKVAWLGRHACLDLTAASLPLLHLHGLVDSLGQIHSTLLANLDILGAGLELHPDWLEGHTEPSILQQHTDDSVSAHKKQTMTGPYFLNTLALSRCVLPLMEESVTQTE